jgi:hypothetical protein
LRNLDFILLLREFATRTKSALNAFDASDQLTRTMLTIGQVGFPFPTSTTLRRAAGTRKRSRT